MQYGSLIVGVASLSVVCATPNVVGQSGLSGEGDSSLSDGTSSSSPPTTGANANTNQSSNSRSPDLNESTPIDVAPDVARHPSVSANPSLSFDSSLVEDRAGDFEGACAADSNGDGYVGFGDLVMVLSTWGPCPVDSNGFDSDAEPEGLACSADFTADGRVDVGDLTMLLRLYGNDCLTKALEE